MSRRTYSQHAMQSTCCCPLRSARHDSSIGAVYRRGFWQSARIWGVFYISWLLYFYKKTLSCYISTPPFHLTLHLPFTPLPYPHLRTLHRTYIDNLKKQTFGLFCTKERSCITGVFFYFMHYTQYFVFEIHLWYIGFIDQKRGEIRKTYSKRYWQKYLLLLYWRYWFK